MASMIQSLHRKKTSEKNLEEKIFFISEKNIFSKIFFQIFFWKFWFFWKKSKILIFPPKIQNFDFLGKFSRFSKKSGNFSDFFLKIIFLRDKKIFFHNFFLRYQNLVTLSITVHLGDFWSDLLWRTILFPLCHVVRKKREERKEGVEEKGRRV